MFHPLFDPAVSEESTFANYRFIFVGGLHRSGTTPLFKVLRDHPMVSGFDLPTGAEREHEGQIHQSVYPPGAATGGPGYFCLDEASWLHEKSDIATDENAERLFSQWKPLWDLSKPYLLEKSPPNLVRMRFLQRLFPSTYVIVIVRHPIPVSLATWKWMGWPKHFVTASGDGYTMRPSTKADVEAFRNSQRLFTESMFYTLLEHWQSGYRRHLEDVPFLERHMIVRYEDFVEDPDHITEQMFSFLELPTGESSRQTRVSSHNNRYFDEWSSISEDILTPECRQFLIDRFSPFASQFGYRFDHQFVASEQLGKPVGNARDRDDS